MVSSTSSSTDAVVREERQFQLTEAREREHEDPMGLSDGLQSMRNPADGIGDRVAEQRRAHGMTGSELARLVGVSPSLISQIERGQSRPSVSTLFALSEALRVPVDAFFSRENADTAPGADPAQPEASREGPRASDGDGQPTPGERRYVVRRAARAAIDIEGGVRWERLTPTSLDNVEFLELVYEPGAQSHESLYQHPGTEMVLVTSGQLDIYVGFDHFRIQAGDSIHFPSSRPHRYVNASQQEARAVTVILPDDTPSPDPNERQRRP